MMLLDWTMLGLGGLYLLFISVLWKGWVRIPKTKNGKQAQADLKVSVIIPVRNEEGKIGQLLTDLMQQDYLASQFEVLVVNDRSADGTVAEIEMLQKEYGKSRIKLFHLSGTEEGSPKKKAIQIALSQAQGKLILLTDGDCRVGNAWISSFVAEYHQTGAKLISGPVAFFQEESLFSRMQSIEFASLVGSGASTIGLGKPTMCNGANLAYEKSVFYEVGGYGDKEQIASGDDEFLMHRISQRFPNGIRFLKDEKAIVRTNTSCSLSGFYQQRKRWASKWKAYELNYVSLLAVAVFFVNLTLVLSPFIWALGFCSLYGLLSLWVIRMLSDFFYLRRVMAVLKLRFFWGAFGLLSLVYPFYVVIIGLMANIGNYQWKGRTFAQNTD